MFKSPNNNYSVLYKCTLFRTSLKSQPSESSVFVFCLVYCGVHSRQNPTKTALLLRAVLNSAAQSKSRSIADSVKKTTEQPKQDFSSLSLVLHLSLVFLPRPLKKLGKNGDASDATITKLCIRRDELVAIA
jgi:hypothetical protein